MFDRISGIEKVYGKEGGVSGPSVSCFLAYSAEKCRRGTLLCFTKFPLSKNVRDKRGCDSHFSVGKFRLTLPQAFIGEPFCDVFQKKSGSEKAFGKKGSREYQDFPSKTFCLTVLKNFIGEHFCAVFQKIFGS